MDIKRNEGTYTLEKDGQSFTITMAEASAFVNQFVKAGLRESVKSMLRDLDGDRIELARYPETFEELVDEIATDLEDEIDNGNFPNDEDIENKISDICSFYDMII